MPEINRTINTNVVEQLKSAVILILVTGLVAFMAGVQYQKNATITVDNHVIVQPEAMEVAEVVETAEPSK